MSKLGRACAGVSVVLLGLAGCGGGGTSGGGGALPGSPESVAAVRGVPVVRALAAGADFSLPGGDDYLVALVNHGDPGGTVALTVNGGGTALPTLPTSRAVEARGHRPQASFGLPAPGGLATARVRATEPAVGSSRVFTVLEPTMHDITATLRVSGSKCLVYVDNDTDAGAFASGDLADLQQAWDTVIYPSDTTNFGPESDVDANGKVILLMTPTIRSGGYGYYYPGDISGNNHADMVYCLVPKPSLGQTYASFRTALLATLVHEFQHLINYNNKGLLRTVGSEESWLNEALSFNSEYVAGFTDTPGGPPERVQAYLLSPESYTLRELSGNYQNGHAGLGFMYVRYLVDHFGQSVLGKLVQSDYRGLANVARATGANTDSLLATVAATIYLSQTGLTTDGNYRFITFNPRGKYTNGGQLAGPRYTTVSAASGAPAFSASWAAAGLRYLRLTGAPSAGLRLKFAGDATNSEVVLIRVPASAP